MIGFVFAVPEPKQKGVLIAKTLAVDPDWRHLGLGSVLIDKVQANAQKLGFDRAIHALQHETNDSLKITKRNEGRRIRTYALFSKSLRHQ